MSVQVLVDEIKEMNAAVLGGEMREVRDGETVLAAMQGGAAEIPLVLQWDDEPHSVVLHEMRGDRVVFFNGLQGDLPIKPGMPLRDDGPARQAEEPGYESFSRAEFLRLFSEREAVCLLSAD